MLEYAVRDNLLCALAEHYEKNPHEFWQISKHELASAFLRESVAELRNEGYVEEAVRGVVRFTQRGYEAYRAGTSFFHGHN
ncbi:MAG TPA: hypothetical protein VGF08_11425 [Terriglobales bacterium]|jgi:hypothetical protein